MTIQESRYITIDNKIITLADVQKLAKVMYTIYKRKNNTDAYRNIWFSVKCDGGAKFTSGDLSIFSDDSPIQSKRVFEIEMSYSSSSKDRIKIELRHNPSIYYKNTISVEGDNPNWVNGTLKKLEEITDGFTPQSTFMNKRSGYIYFFFSILLSVLVVRFGLFIGEQIINNSNDTLTTKEILLVNAMQVALAVIISMFLSRLIISILNRIRDLYPSVELQIAPDHKLIEKRKRVWMSSIGTLIAMPLILQIVFEYVKSLIVK